MVLPKSAMDSDCLQNTGHGPVVRHLELCDCPSIYLSTLSCHHAPWTSAGSTNIPCVFLQASPCMIPWVTVPFFLLFPLQVLFTFQVPPLTSPPQWSPLWTSLLPAFSINWPLFPLNCKAFLRTLTLPTMAIIFLPVLDCICGSPLQNYTFIKTCHHTLYTMVLRVSSGIIYIQSLVIHCL